MAVTNSVINIPVRPVGTNFEVRGPKVSTDCDVLKCFGGPFPISRHALLFSLHDVTLLMVRTHGIL